MFYTSYVTIKDTNVQAEYVFLAKYLSSYELVYGSWKNQNLTRVFRHVSVSLPFDGHPLIQHRVNKTCTGPFKNRSGKFRRFRAPLSISFCRHRPKVARHAIQKYIKTSRWGNWNISIVFIYQTNAYISVCQFGNEPPRYKSSRHYKDREPTNEVKHSHLAN